MLVSTSPYKRVSVAEKLRPGLRIERSKYVKAVAFTPILVSGWYLLVMHLERFFDFLMRFLIFD